MIACSYKKNCIACFGEFDCFRKIEVFSGLELFKCPGQLLYLGWTNWICEAEGAVEWMD